jgi:predicted permease
MNNNGENPQMSTKSMSIENNNKESVDKYKEKAKSFTDKIVNKISHMDDIRRRNEVAVEDNASNVRFITFGLFTLIGFIVVIYTILVVVVADTAIQSANVFFVVTILSISILVGTLVYRIGLSK